MDTLPAGQSSKSPAFSFYAKEFLAATLAWALDTRGAYVTLLAYQWDAGSVPANDMSSLGRVLGISSTKARLVWAIISDKFERGADGQWRNGRLEQERQKQKDRREALQANGARGGRPKNLKVNQEETNRLSESKPNNNLNESLAFTSSSSSDSKNESQKRETRTPVQGSGAFEPGSLPRDHKTHVLCGPSMRICLIQWQYAVLEKAYNDEPAKARVVIVQFIEILERGLGAENSIGRFSEIEKEFHIYLKSIGRVPPKIVPIKDESAQLARLAAIERGEIRR